MTLSAGRGANDPLVFGGQPYVGKPFDPMAVTLEPMSIGPALRTVRHRGRQQAGTSSFTIATTRPAFSRKSCVLSTTWRCG